MGHLDALKPLKNALEHPGFLVLHNASIFSNNPTIFRQKNMKAFGIDRMVKSFGFHKIL